MSDSDMYYPGIAVRPYRPRPDDLPKWMNSWFGIVVGTVPPGQQCPPSCHDGYRSLVNQLVVPLMYVMWVDLSEPSPSPFFTCEVAHRLNWAVHFTENNISLIQKSKEKRP